MAAAEEFDSGDEEPVNRQFKVILLGDGAVGKTSVATRFSADDFRKQYKQTIGVDFMTSHISLPNDTRVTMQLWDIGGQNIGSRMITRYISGAHAILLLFDITSYDSFANLEDWFRLVRDTFRGGAMPYVALVGNKVDLDHLRAVSRRKQEAFGDENDMFMYEVSAKTGYKVRSMFQLIAADLCGVKLRSKELQTRAKVVQADIVQYRQHDPAVTAPHVPGKAQPGGKRACVVQ